ncbi:hypothetical protein [Desulfobacter sp.]|uniref:hypothetical protein n=1 Tax=Desulfobacter sp. TaxID=2294 RepID=UPI003D12492D
MERFICKQCGDGNECELTSHGLEDFPDVCPFKMIKEPEWEHEPSAGVTFDTDVTIDDIVLQEQFEKCKNFQPMFCDSSMCPCCTFCNRNIALEYHKQNDICPKCHGAGISNSIEAGSLKFISYKCNVCGGTGWFPVDFVRREFTK